MPKGRHLGSQNGAKIDPKTIQNRRRFLRAKKMLFKTLLDPSWADLSPILERSDLENRAPARAGAIFSKFTFLTKIWLQDSFWTENGPSWVPKGFQMGGQEGPKRHQKRNQNGIKILIDFYTDFEPNLEVRGTRPRRDRRVSGGMRGAWLSSLNSRIRIRQFRGKI